MKTRVASLFLGIVLTAAPALPAQGPHRSPSHFDTHETHVPSGAFAGGSFNYARPQGEFRDFVDEGFGGAAHFLFAPGNQGLLGLRVDASVLNYGSETQRVMLSPTVGGRITVKLNTTNNIAFFGAGPQIGLPDGRLRPYLGGFVGVAYLYTESSLEGNDDDYEFARTTNQDDATLSYGGRGGVYIPVRGGASPISVDLGFTYQNNGEAEYLREGDIRDHPDGTISFTPSRSDTDLLNFHVGVSIGIPRRVRGH
ncbi:MAG TPA: hypothetical protein VHG28_03345 [Longimicrobiaceae bacterium]|nr:hypothetical protein [Longimicrobiaceae bacterium]